MNYIQTPEGSVRCTRRLPKSGIRCTEGFDCPAQVDYLHHRSKRFSPAHLRWKSHEGALRSRLRTTAIQARERGEVPVFLTYNLGKAQESYDGPGPDRYSVQIHGAGYPLCENLHPGFGMDLGAYTRYNARGLPKVALITPMSTAGHLHGYFQSGRNTSRYCTRWAALESRAGQLNVTSSYRSQNHIGFFELARLVPSTWHPERFT